MNQADSMIFTTENFLKDNGDKIPADQKPGIEQALQPVSYTHLSKCEASREIRTPYRVVRDEDVDRAQV